MQTLQVNGRYVELNDKGYLLHFEDWNKSVAEAMARTDELPLTHCHWIAIEFMRDFYRKYEVPPSARSLIKAVGEQISEHGCSKRTIDKIFPKGGCQHACRLAGLPDAYCHSC